MGAWRDLIKSTSPTTPSHPSTYHHHNQRLRRPFNALSSKPIRSLLSLVLFIIIISSLSFAIRPTNLWTKTHEVIKKRTKPIWIYLTPSSKPKNRWDISDDQINGIEPEFSVDPINGLRYPPDINPLKMNTFKRANATFVSLVRNEELVSMMASMRGVEDRVNRKLGYPWVFLNEKPFDENFKKQISSMTRSKVYFGLIPRDHWSYPTHIDQTKASDKRKEMEANKIIYGGSESYRHMCRYQSGFFFRHPLMMQFDYYWRVEPGVEYYCDVDYDPFLFMQENKKLYGFTITLYEYRATIESLWSTTQAFIKSNPQYLHPKSALHFIVDDISKGINGTYNLCHFWSNFEIGDMRLWRSEAYMKYFQYLDKQGGFFYERWGDAPVHSIAASLFLPANGIHQFDDIAYRHPPFMHCPSDLDRFHSNGKCFCDPNSSFDRDGYSCMKQWWRVGGEPK